MNDLENILAIADKNYFDKNFNEAYKYYNQVIQVYPNNSLVIYKIGVCRLFLSNIDTLEFMNSLKDAIRTYSRVSDDTKKINEFKIEIIHDLVYDIAPYYYNLAFSNYQDNIDNQNALEKLWDDLIKILNILKNAIAIIEAIDDNSINKESKNELLIAAYDMIIVSTVNICSDRDINYKEATIDNRYRDHYVAIYDEYTKKMLAINPYYNTQHINRSTDKKGCYVATCVYGSYNHPSVWVLRRYRDYSLAKSFGGRLFIKTYYFISPKVVRLFGDTKWFKKVCLKRLDKFVLKLKEKGYNDLPYDDINW